MKLGRGPHARDFNSGADILPDLQFSFLTSLVFNRNWKGLDVLTVQMKRHICIRVEPLENLRSH